MQQMDNVLLFGDVYHLILICYTLLTSIQLDIMHDTVFDVKCVRIHVCVFVCATPCIPTMDSPVVRPLQ